MIILKLMYIIISFILSFYPFLLSKSINLLKYDVKHVINAIKALMQDLFYYDQDNILIINKIIYEIQEIYPLFTHIFLLYIDI